MNSILLETNEDTFSVVWIHINYYRLKYDVICDSTYVNFIHDIILLIIRKGKVFTVFKIFKYWF